MRRLAITLMTCVVVYGPDVAIPQPLKDSAYLCIQEFSGGLAYDAHTKRWDGAAFKTDTKFILRLRYERPSLEGTLPTYYDYKLVITPFGTSEEHPCTPPGPTVEQRWWTPTITIGPSLFFTCTTSPGDYRFNLRTNRFLFTYPHGYVDGKDDINNMPHVSGGTCSKIE